MQEGDKLRSLAANFDTTPSVIKKLNRLTMDFLYPDQVGSGGGGGCPVQNPG